MVYKSHLCREARLALIERCASVWCCSRYIKQTECLLKRFGIIHYALFRQRKPCRTRLKSGTGIRYPTLTIDPRRSFKCISPKTVPHITRPFRQSGCIVKLLPKRIACYAGRQIVPFYDGLWFDPSGRRTHDLPCERRTPLLKLPDTVC